MNPMVLATDLSGVSSALTTLSEGLQGIVVPIAVVAMVLCGIGWIISGSRGADNMKEMFKRILVGCAIALGASAIVTWITDIANTIA